MMTLSAASRLATRLASSRAPMPILQDVLLKPLSSGGSTLYATNLVTYFEADIDQSISGEVCVPASVLAKVLRSVPACDLQVEGPALCLRTEGFEARITNSHKPGDWPKSAAFTEGDDGVVRVPFDRDAFRWVSTDAATDDSRPVLTAVALHKESGAMWASDGFRLRLSGPVDGDSQNPVALIPSSIAAMIPPNCESALIKGTLIRFEGDYRLMVNLIQGTWPDFRQLLPKSTAWSVSLNRMALLWALRPLDGIAETVGGSAMVKVVGTQNEGVRLSTENASFGSVKSTVSCQPSADFKFAMNWSYLMAMAHGAGETIDVSGNEPSGQVMFDQENRREVIMPMWAQW